MGRLLTGTPGYAADGGRIHREKEAQEQKAVITDFHAQCSQEMQAAELDPIRSKVVLSNASPDEVPPFAIAAFNTFPSDRDRPAIAKWAAIREECNRRITAVPHGPAPASAFK